MALEDEVLAFTQHTAITRQIVHGGEDVVVQTEGGQIRSFARLQRDFLARATVQGKNSGFVVAAIGDSMTYQNSALGLRFSQPINITGVFASFAGLDCPMGQGTLVFDAGTRTLQWAAPGDAPGPAIAVQDGIYRLPSNNPLWDIRVDVTAQFLPVTNKSDNIVAAQVALPNDTRYWRRDTGAWMYYADAATMGAFDWLPNFGIGGNASSDIARRLAQLWPSNPDIVVVQCGTNDIIARGLPAGDAVANTVAVWDKILEQGKPVIAILIPPRFGVGDGSPYSAAKNSNILEFNTRCTAEAAQRKGVYIVNVWPKSVDLTSVNAVVKPGHTKDGLHPDGPMAQDMGEQVAIILRALAPINRQISAVGAGGYYHPLNNRGGNLLPPNLGGFAGIGGALGAGCVVGTGLADGYQLARRTGAALTCMPNKIVDPDGGPDWQELVFTGAAVDGENFWLLPNLMNAANLANFADGDIISSELEFKIFGAGCTGLYGEMLLTGGNLTNWEALQLRNIRNGIRLQHGVMRWEPLKWRAGVTAIQPRLWVVSKQGASFKVWLRNFAMVKKIA